MTDTSNAVRSAAVFGASGGIGRAIVAQLATSGVRVWAGSRIEPVEGEGIRTFFFDLADETSIVSAVDMMSDDPPDTVIVATGILTHADGSGPERSYRNLDGQRMADAFAVNTIGPALIAKHTLRVFDRERRNVFAALSARVGSIGDNRLGGWHSYRASKSALNMVLKNLSIEMNRTHKQTIVCGLHPGTVDTPLSEPFQSNLPEGQLASSEMAARHLLQVIDDLSLKDSGRVLDWRGHVIEN